MSSNEGVNLVPISQLCEIITRSTDYYKQEDIVGEHEGAMIISPNNIIDNRLYFNDVKYYSWEGYNLRPRDMLHVGDIIMCKFAAQGSPFKSAFVYELPELAMTNPSMFIFKNIKCNPEYLQLVFSSKEFQDILKTQSKGVMPTISSKALCSISVPIPSEEVQKKLVKIFLDYRNKNYELINTLLKEAEARNKEYEYYLGKSVWNI